MPARKAGIFHLSGIMSNKSIFKIGYVAKTHGLKGEITMTFLPGIFAEILDEIVLESNGEHITYIVEQYSARPDLAYLKLKGINHIDEAKMLRGKPIYLPSNLRPKSAKGEFYDDEIVGFLVTDIQLGEIGTVAQATSEGGVRLLMVMKGRKEIIIPIDGPFIQSVNKTKKTIQVDLPDGFLEI
jgi:16S rRNA processing protein RimM